MISGLIIFFILGSAVFIWATFIEPGLFRINRHEAVLNKPLPRPVKILHLTDTHFAGKHKNLSRFFDRLAKESVDLVFVTGDILDCENGLPSCAENFRKLKPRYGIYAVLGNHDYFDYRFLDIFFHNSPGRARPLLANRADLFKKVLEESGVQVLINETRFVEVEETVLLIHGLDDPTSGRADLLKAMQQFDAARPNFLLTHTIDVFLDIGENEIDMSFSGHSHGGQICLPFLGPLLTHTSLGRPYASGIFDLRGAICVVSRGLNASRFFWSRLLCPPEAILLTVHGSSSASGV